MNSELNIDRLRTLLAYLHEITQLQLSLHDSGGHEIYSVKSRSAFCDLICNSSQGHARCVASDVAAVASMSAPFAPFQYRCHVGLIDSVVPITEKGKVVNIILFGQILDDTSLQAQWAITEKAIAWHPQQPELKAAFFHLPRLSSKQIRACYEIINACVSEIRLERFLKASAQTEVQRLEAYIDTHFDQPLCLEDIARALSISRSRLFALAARIDPVMTITQHIARHRITMAKRLLDKPHLAVHEVAAMVGIPDYNYFTKVFRKWTGMTPSQFRKRQTP